jgi:GntR family galactonate operon transcriptional repressor
VTRLHREAVDVLLDSIVSKQYEVGQLLPKEELLAERFEMSRGTVREALRALEERNVVMVRHGRGALVRPPEEWNVLDPVVARALAAGRRRRDFLREVDALRQILEPEAARLAAERASEAQRAELRVRGEELADSLDVPRAAKRIRRLVADASGNRPLAGTLRALDDAVEQALRAKDVDACARLAAAVAGGDPDAARAAARELSSAT